MTAPTPPGMLRGMDITEIILEQHHRQRRMFAVLDELPRDDTEALAAVWARLEVFLEVHAEAEERFFYPRLLRLGKGNPDGDVQDEVEDAVKDHNEIRDAVKATHDHEVGTDAWWTAVWDARKANDDHMAEEEREDLLDFRHSADLVRTVRGRLDVTGAEVRPFDRGDAVAAAR